ncbi:response regulator [Thermoactinospora rubra]|uniref:response regulator n=1 Tax=Thermoactinospora rubra TaxID=1088767 RepID=UPI001F0B274E|nr:response regulator transcription factor [Thermoactinospora rubra]
MELRCLIVDDSPRFLQAARRLLEQQGVRVVGVAATGHEAVERAGALRPDVALVDVGLGAENGFEVASRLGRTPVIMISTMGEEELAPLLAGNRAIGFLPKADLSAAAIAWLLSAPEGR